jgi:MerR family transcriptional regulator, light-induced transcriptional regulator
MLFLQFSANVYAMSQYNIHIASQLSGVAAATIRAWEKRYNALNPNRADNGHRLYSDSDIEKLTMLQMLTQAGHTISKIARLDLDGLQGLIKTLSPHEAPYSNHQEDLDTQRMLSGILLALRAYKLDIISYELEKAKRDLGPRDFALNVIVPLFREIGIRVMQGTFSIVQEHTLSAIIQFHMGQVIAHSYSSEGEQKDVIILAAPEGELHEIGLLASCLLCVQYNIPFLFLGKDLPVDSLAEATNQINPKAILLGVTKGHELTDKLILQDYLKELRQKTDPKIQITVGGNIKPYVRTEIDKMNVGYLPTLESLDQYIRDFK